MNYYLHEEKIESAWNLLHKKVMVTTKIRISPEYEPDPYFSYPNKNGLVSFTGYLKTVDPETKSTVLCCIRKRAVERSIIVMGHCIESILPLQSDEHQMSDNDSSQPHETQQIDGICEPFSIDQVKGIMQNEDLARIPSNLHSYLDYSEPSGKISPEHLRFVKDTIKDWLAINRIPVKENEGNGELIIANCVTLKPPYTNECDYICPNRIVLYRTRQIIVPHLENKLQEKGD